MKNNRKGSLPAEAITQEHVLGAAAALDNGKRDDFKAGTKFAVYIRGIGYPPKALVSLAAESATSRPCPVDTFTSGEGSQCFRILENLGFEILEKKIEQWKAAYWVMTHLPPDSSISSNELAELFVQDPRVSTAGYTPQGSVYTALYERSDKIPEGRLTGKVRYFEQLGDNRWALTDSGKANPPGSPPKRAIGDFDDVSVASTSRQEGLSLAEHTRFGYLAWMLSHVGLNRQKALAGQATLLPDNARSRMSDAAGALLRQSAVALRQHNADINGFVYKKENYTEAFNKRTIGAERSQVYALVGDAILGKPAGLRKLIAEAPGYHAVPAESWSSMDAALMHLSGHGQTVPPGSVGFTAKDIQKKGAFLELDELERMLRRLRSRKNLILRGAPGTGKTFLARLLAYALMGSRDAERLSSVQFHPSTSYEDFIRGYRPTTTAGAFELTDGPFLQACERARRDPDRNYVVLIDEINRANLSQAFGELFLLLEEDKRSPEYAVTPLYPREEGERLFVPPNLYLIGTMNIADRSLALVDFALRRRFAFCTLEPRFENARFKKWLLKQGVEPAVLAMIVQRLSTLNIRIEDDSTLGPAFKVGHSFFCPNAASGSGYGKEWFTEIIETEIGPLLEEYWYDDLAKARDATRELLE